MVGVHGALDDELTVRCADGRSARARTLGHHERWPVALVRVSGCETRPLRPAKRASFAPERWALVLSVSASGEPEPFAGVFLEPPQENPWARLMAASRRGAAVLDGDGRLLGVAIDDARRRTRVVPISALMPFLIGAARR